ncbi:AhpD-like protein [Venustampulla echinocandica]|uniref:AhpD-like protein n=1 Tax=Venustampulla echinocandica TaxID=2656787 RepID=A0A370TUI7_9HELO|nr:AhpD-like protein [Venustampulla echinocandica]RDL39191.1 AhpD-like protein [Venustampulla echinocandica]
MRLPYVDPSSSTFDSPENSAILSRVSARRAPRPLQSLDLALLHAPPVADGWNSFLGAIRTKTSLSDDVREVAICRVAVINEAWYEWGHHAPLAKAGGVSEEALKILGDRHLGGMGGEKAKGLLSEKLWAVVRYTDEMTANVKVPEDVFGEIKRLFSEQEVVEITATIAAYNCVSRFLVALDVGEKNSLKGPEL